MPHCVARTSSDRAEIGTVPVGSMLPPPSRGFRRQALFDKQAIKRV